MKLSILDGSFSVCRLYSHVPIPNWVDRKCFHSITKTDSEISVVCRQDKVPEDVLAERNWKIIKVEGTLDFSLTGVLSSIATPLADAKISIFTISTFDTDYVLVKEANLLEAKIALSLAGHEI